jgi:hypothetical protein
LFFIKYYAPISISSLNAAPPPDVAQDSVPDPFVDNACPAVPSVAGSVQILFVETVAGDLKPT